LNAPVSDVAVWATWPVFVQQTVPPLGMFTVGGSKKLSPISTSVEPLGQVEGPPTTSFSTLASEVETLARPPAAITVFPTATLAVNERAAFKGGTGDQVFEATSYLETSFSPSKVGTFVPPIAYSCPETTARPAVFLAIGMSSSWSGVVQVSAAMS
jgi:hypothetical protein